MSTVLEESLSRPPISEGKTKRIFEAADDPTKVIVVSKNDITAGDGAKHDIIENKGMFANQTTCNVFRLLHACGVSVAFEEQLGPNFFGNSFRAQKCIMLQYEVVVRREAHGSCLERSPHLTKGHIFPRLVVEFFLKTSGKMWKDHPLICDDPLMYFDRGSCQIGLHDPKQPAIAQMPSSPFLKLQEEEVFTQDNEEGLIEKMDTIARWTFLILEKAWQLQGRKLVDFKVEFGIGPSGKLLLADVIDNDSWRVLDSSGNFMDKQIYRDGGDLNEVTAKYRHVAELTGQFTLPSQQLILWCGSDKDDLTPFRIAIKGMLLGAQLGVRPITCSAHKQPSLAYRLLQQHLSEVSDAVIIAFIGRSNGAGPMLAANATVPVITVPANYKEFPEDVWSSLRAPSDVPVMTVLDPANAVLAALQILAMRNPAIYAALRLEQEERLIQI